MVSNYEILPDDFEKYFLDFTGMLRYFKLTEDE
jgi:hypothetical protein